LFAALRAVSLCGDPAFFNALNPAEPFNNIRKHPGSSDHIFFRNSFVNTVNPVEFFHADQQRAHAVAGDSPAPEKPGIRSAE
jgi:hypothetical protein